MEIFWEDIEKRVNLDVVENDKVDGYVKDFIDSCENPYSRERTYDVVCALFRKHLGKLPKDPAAREETIDMLARGLYMFLANWGMLRNSFLLKYNYRCLKGVCEIVCDAAVSDEYGCLVTADLLGDSFYKDEDAVRKYASAVVGLGRGIRLSMRDVVREYEPKFNGVTHVLVSKILLVTLGCVPAYDKYVRTALEAMSMTFDRISEEGITEMLCLVRRYREPLKNAMDDHPPKTDCPYSVMKYVDMVLWKRGFELGS